MLATKEIQKSRSNQGIKELIVCGYIRCIAVRSIVPLEIVNLCLDFFVQVCRNMYMVPKHQNVIYPLFKARTYGKSSEIFMGRNNIIGVGVQIITYSGGIKIGDNNIIQDGTLIMNKSTQTMIIGNGNLFECGSS